MSQCGVEWWISMETVIFQLIYDSHDTNHGYGCDNFEMNFAGDFFDKDELVLEMTISLIS